MAMRAARRVSRGSAAARPRGAGRSRPGPARPRRRRGRPRQGLAPRTAGRELRDRVGQRACVARRHHHAAARHGAAELGVGMRGHDHGPAAREHAGQLRGHHQVGRVGALRQHVDVGAAEQLVEPLGRLQVEEVHVAQPQAGIHQRRAARPVAADDEVQRRRIRQQRGRLGQQLDALLVAQAARVEHQHRVGRDAERGAVAAGGVGCLGIAGRRGPDRAQVDAVREQHQPLGRHALVGGLGEHRGRDRRDAVEAPHQPAFGRQRHAPHAAAAHQAQAEGRVHLVVLDVQPRPAARELRQQQHAGRAEQRRLHHHHHIGPPACLRQQQRQARQHERGQVREAGRRARTRGHPGRRAPQIDAVPVAAAVGPGRMALGHLPLRKEGRRRDHAHRVAARAQPARHLARVLAHAGQLGREVHRVQQDLHGRLRSAPCARPRAMRTMG